MTDLTVNQAVQADRNAVVLTWLARLQLATAEQLSRFGWPGVSRAHASWRLRQTREAGLVEFVRTRRSLHDQPTLYRLTPAGAQAAATLLGDPHITHGVRLAATEGIHLEHRLQVNDTVLRLVDRLGQDATEVLLPHRRRLRWQASGGVWHEVTPDVVLVCSGIRKVLVIEYDRGLRGLADIAQQLHRYREAAEQPDLPEWVGRSSIVYALHPATVIRAAAILYAAASAGLEPRVVAVAVQDLVEVVTHAVAKAQAVPTSSTCEPATVLPIAQRR